ncbi:MAG: flagellar M-ring protein FliF [Ignavibacteriae bacterium]|nr:MAG: flagellar M-ring protein FliF [Ignavibacteriota bacterium]
MNKAKDTYSAILGIFNKLSVQQRLMLGGIAVVAVVLLVFIMFTFNEPNYTVLYSNLSSEEASQVIDYLNSQSIPYKIENGGTAISVSKINVYEVRLALAGKGIPSSGMIGYEIFDKSTIGMSEFMQKINFKRALEGEISRTIIQQDGIENARVHIVTPEKAIFKDEQKEATASVVLKLRSGYLLSQNSISAIINLVASSIEGLNPDNVTIIDNKGRLLTKKNDKTEIALSNGKQYEIKSNIENYLAGKAQTILEKIVGYDNSDVKVNVDLDFKRIEKTLETIDPESQIAISEQTSKNSSSGKSLKDTNQVFAETMTTNYELSKSIEHMIEGSGNIKRITVAAVINGVQKEIVEEGVTKYVNEPRDEEQLKQLEMLLRQAVGIDDTREDKISIVSIPFENDRFANKFDDVSTLEQITPYFKYIMMLLAVGGALFVLKGLLGKLKDETIMIGTPAGSYANQSLDQLANNAPTWQPSGGELQQNLQKKKRKPNIDVGDIEDEISEEAVLKQMKQDKITNYVSKNPAEAAKLINSWLKEDEYS